MSVALLFVWGHEPCTVWALEEEEDGHGLSEEHHGEGGSHHLSLFLGSTYKHEESSFTVGGDYEYRANKLFGVGALLDYAGGPARDTIFGVPVFAHVTEQFKGLVAPGIEIHDGETEFLLRFGAMYDFEVGEYTVAPALNFDFTKGHDAIVWGANFGRHF
jgi:hypothetical protein